MHAFSYDGSISGQPSILAVSSNPSIAKSLINGALGMLPGGVKSTTSIEPKSTLAFTSSSPYVEVVLSTKSPNENVDVECYIAYYTMKEYVNGNKLSNFDWAVSQIASFALSDLVGYSISKYNSTSYNYDKYDNEIVAWSYFWNNELGLTGNDMMLPNLVKAMIMAESDGGQSSPNDPMQIFGDNACKTLARIGTNYQYPNDNRIPKAGYNAVKNAFTSGVLDATKVDYELSIAFGIRWLGHKIQNAIDRGDATPRASGVTAYNGGGFDRIHGTQNGYLKYVRRIMSNPNDYINGIIPKV
jgi:hypothetical protein